MTNQCGTPVLQRVGDWTCAATVPPTPRIRPMTQTTGYCLILTNTPGCWTLKVEDSRYTAYFNTKNGVYGVLWGKGGTLLGQYEVDTTWQLSGGASIDYWVYIRSTRTTYVPEFRNSIENGAQNVLGSEVAYADWVKVGTAGGNGITVGAGQQVRFHPSIGLYDNATYDHEGVSRIRWGIPGAEYFYDSWWVQVKGPVAHDFSGHGGYEYTSYSVLPLQPWISGHNNNEVFPGRVTK